MVRTWRYTFYAAGTEWCYMHVITEEMWNQHEGQNWAVYVGAVTREIMFGEGPEERGRTLVRGELTVAVCRRIEEALVLIDVCLFPRIIPTTLTTLPHSRMVVVQPDGGVDPHERGLHDAHVKTAIFPMMDAR